MGKGYPIGHTSLLCLFSKIQKNGPQGALLGWFGFSGSLARVAFPLTAGNSLLFVLLWGVCYSVINIAIVLFA